MRIEANYPILIYTLIGVFVVLALAKTKIPRKLYKVILALVVAIAMPSFFPGHGEIIMLIPNSGLFAVASSEAKAIGVIFTIINYFIARLLMYKVFGFFKEAN